MTEPKQRRTVKGFFETMKARLDREVEILNKSSSELDEVKGRLNFITTLLSETSAKQVAAEFEYQEMLRNYRLRSARAEAIRELMKDLFPAADDDKT